MSAGPGGEDPWGFAARPRREPAAQPAAASSDGIRSMPVGPSLHRRAWPVAFALAMVAASGFITEMVGAAQMISLAGPASLLVMYPLGGVSLLLVALLQFTVVDRQARLPMLRRVLLGYAAVFVAALALILSGVVPVVATGAAWLLSDQLNFLVPLLLWALVNDEFTVAEARRVFPWVVSWVYGGQVAGLALATVSPALLDRLGVPLPWLLAVVPVVCLGVALWLPRVWADSAAAVGRQEAQPLRESLADAWSFVAGVPVWRTLLTASVLTFVAGMTAHLAFMADVGVVLGSDAGALQAVLAGVSLAGFLVCWLVQLVAAQPVQERLGIPGALLVLPVSAVVAGLLLAGGAAAGSIAVMALGISAWRIPMWSIDANARRAALGLVPDEKRARVSFLVDLTPVALGLVVSAALAAVAMALGLTWLAPLLAALVAAAAIPFGVRVRRGWDDSLVNWRLRRRKQRHAVGLDDDGPA